VSRENVARVREMADAFERGDYAAAIKVFHPDVVWEMGTETSIQGQTAWRGREGVWEANRRWLTTWDEYRSGLKKVIDADPHVVAVMWDEGRGRGSGVLVRRDEFAVVYTFKSGLIIHTQLFPTKEQALDAVGLPDLRT
jgi:ketosteroid isomerase-like protein